MAHTRPKMSETTFMDYSKGIFGSKPTSHLPTYLLIPLLVKQEISFSLGNDTPPKIALKKRKLFPQILSVQLTVPK